MISAFTNIFKIPELRQRILFTLGMLVIVRAGAAITIPGVNAHVLNEWFNSEMARASSGGCRRAFQYLCRRRAWSIAPFFRLASCPTSAPRS